MRFPKFTERGRLVCFASVIALTHVVAGLPHIGSFITADEHYWVEERIPNYREAWTEGKWEKTLINDKPGVSLAIVSLPTLFLRHETGLSCRTEEGKTSSCDPDTTSDLYTSFRIPILLLNAVLLAAMFFAIRAFSGTGTAFLASMFTAVSPHLLGMSQIVNPDSILWSTGAIGLFSMTAFFVSGRRRFLATGIFGLTLALLSKYVAIVVIFFLPVILTAVRITDGGTWDREKRNRLFLGLLSASFLPFFLFVAFAPGILSSEERILGFLSAGTGHVLLPWSAYLLGLGATAALLFVRIPERTTGILTAISSWALRGVGAVFLVATIVLLSGRLFLTDWETSLFGTIPFDIKDISNAKYYTDRVLSVSDIAFLELSPVIYSLPVATLLLGILSIAIRSFRKRQAVLRRSAAIPLTFLSFIVIEIAAFGISGVLAIPRYVLLALPIFAFLAADACRLIAGIIRDRLPDNSQAKRLSTPAIGVAALLLTVGSLSTSAPFHTNFTNMLLPEKALTAHAWGYGGYEAAKYLNSLPDADRLTVWSDYYGFCEFFRGDCLTNYTFDPEKIRPDYYVLTRRGMLRYMPRSDDWERKSGLTAYRRYDDTDPAWELDIAGKKENFVKVIRVEHR